MSIVVIAGPPASGKSSEVKKYTNEGFIRLNRDELGGSLKDEGIVYTRLRELARQGKKEFVLDNTYGTFKSRATLLAVAKEVGLQVELRWMDATIEQTQFLAALRQARNFGHVLRIEEYAAHKKDPNCFPPIAQYAFFKRLEMPTETEGFASVDIIPLKINLGPEYKNRALILDYDGTLRITKSGRNSPRDPDDVVLLDRRREVVQAKQKEGWLILGASNQSGISKSASDPDHIPELQVNLCFQRTNDLLGLGALIDYLYAPDRGGVPQSFLPKPMPGMGAYFVEKYKLNPAACVFVGDMTKDKTFAARCGFQFALASEFFR